ncbi:MAG: TrmH family RNA methyltransferase [Saprospiraceae bacterium]
MNNKQLEYKDERGSFEERLAFINNSRKPLSLLLDSLDDAKNIGGIFRIADAANISHIYLYNCNHSLADKRLQRTARSTQKYVPSSIVSSFEDFLNLKKQYQTIALEITSQSIPYTSLDINSPVLLIIGAENQGVSKEILEEMDVSIHIPMHGINTSMNVMTATAVATFHIINQF